jgi:hypothetical protein
VTIGIAGIFNLGVNGLPAAMTEKFSQGFNGLLAEGVTE